MQFYADICLAVVLICLIFIAVGLYRPWVMLWWEDTQNRRKVLKIYGGAALIFFVAYLLLTYLII
ncbi:MAG: hypothetical protein R3345_03980 [Fulvivirga sp.]|nr:hypothetical protein [Fulvivirga sp.]